MTLKILKKILLIIVNMTWCLPQNLLGFLIYLFALMTGNIISKHDYEFIKHDGTTRSISYFTWKHPTGCMSLGEFRFLCKMSINDVDYYLRHEYGHTLQSYILGPFYLIVIALPSILWCSWLSNWKCFVDKDYDWFYTEQWASNIGTRYLK